MVDIRQNLKDPGVRWAAGGCLLLILFGACVVAQTTNAPEGSGTGKPLNVSIEALFQGKRLQDGASVQAPVVIYLFPHLETAPKPHAGDTVEIDFFANDQKLCSQKAVWQDEKRPAQRPGQAVPMWIMPAQFLVSDCVWSNPAPGRYTLKAHAAGLNGLSAEAAPLRIKVVAASKPEQGQ